MKISVYLRSALRGLRQSAGQFIAITLIIFMGVLLFVGIKSVGPDLEETVQNYVDQHKVSDLTITGTAGLTATDLEIVQQVKGIHAELGHSFPFADEKKGLNLQVYSYPKKEQQNTLQLVKGAYPKVAQEILVDSALKKQYPIGSKLVIASDQLKQKEFKVTGFIESPLYVDRTEKGTTNIGDGSLDGYVYLPEAAFSSKVYSTMYVRFSDLDHLPIASQAYESALDKKEEKIQDRFDQRKKTRRQELIAQGEVEIAKQQKELDPAQTQLAALQKIKTPNYILTERSANPGFSEFTSLSSRIDAIGNVFPVFFFLIGVLITFTTITRMVEEDRSEIGTLKALGYRNSEISKKYLLYAFLTGASGTILGILAGTKLVPPLVFSMLKKINVFPYYPTHFWIWPILLAIAASLVATLVATIYILAKDLRERPMTLLMPKAPKPGKRIILEYIKPFWRRLSFNQKVTYRNLFRYKARMILTILGIAGCTGLMVAGFGLRDSIGKVADRQFTQLTHYEALVSLEDGLSAANTKEVERVIDANSKAEKCLLLHTEQVKFKQTNVSDQTATLYAAAKPAQLKSYFTLKKMTGDSATQPTKAGAIISKDLAKIFDVNVDETLKIQTAAGKTVKLKVAGITENYLGHNVFIDQNYLKQLTQETPLANTFLVKTKKMTSQEEKRSAKTLQKTGYVLATTFLSDQINKQAAANANLQPIVLLFIVLSGTLAFVVLFNLTNINISERERELATIKVLGFYDQEVTMHIVRENIIFTIFGILFGFGIGKLLTWFIITMAASDLLSFPLIIPASGYLISTGMTILFSLVVTLITHRKLKKIDMIGALKSNE
ncbi:MAG: ABC transporter permease [Enterococcaceae bacterium]|jgi:putative ABC transport system permease protein|nr:ABC transporter permease [Enterococcaceae bacterium]MCI1918821.1 ABC transporter permease [Enterococcaceae bacterium]